MTKPPDLPDFPAVFVHHFAAATNPPQLELPKRARGRPAQLPTQHVVAGLAWHVIQPSGTFAHNMSLLGDTELCDSALSYRRQALGAQPWLDAMAALLKPLAEPQLHPGAFYNGMRLVGVDGTTVNVANSPAMKSAQVKTKARRGTAAFHRISCAALCELGTHTPIAVRIAKRNEAESVLATQLVQQLQTEDLLIADRYYGSGRWVERLMELPTKPSFLIRVAERFRCTPTRELHDGSKLVEVLDRHTGKKLLLRQIKAKIRRPGRKWVKLRFWTNLLDPVLHPAQELVPLYAMRWEQEIAFYELKCHLHHNNLLRSHTITTATQEICALFIAQAIVAALRSDAAQHGCVPIMQISFAKTLEACRTLCWLAATLGKDLPPELMLKLRQRVRQQLADQRSKPRRRRTCPRRVRQPIKRWLRQMKNTYQNGAFECRIRR